MLHEQKQDLLLRKVDRRKNEIRNFMVSNVMPITDIVYRETTEFESYEDAVKATGYKPIRVGEHWGGGINGWFKLRIIIPGEWKGKEVAAYINIGGEACAFLNGTPYQGVDGNHEEVLLTKSAKGGEMIELVIDASSGAWWDPGSRRPTELSKAEIGTRNPEVEDYWYSLEHLYNLANVYPKDIANARRGRLIYTMSKSVDVFDYDHTDEASLRKSAKAANAILKKLFDQKAEPSATNVAVHGHSHIDVAWLWPYRETMRKCSRTFSSVMRLMEQYPEYIFSQSQAQLYEFTKEKYPELYEEIKKRVKEGRWDVTGSMWVEADCNLSSGESLIRQVLVGKNFYKDEFGIETDVLWLPDVFGYSAALPQILKKAEVPYFSTIKISWSQFNTFPYNTFYWKGIDGTSVLAHFPPTGDYNAYPDPNKLRWQVHNFKEKDRSDWSLLSYGWGDGGGGPDRRHLEFLRRSKDVEGLPRCKQTKVTDFFHTIDRETDDYPEWVGELYLELHRGTYTTQGRNKRYNRKSEFLYRDAEILGSIAAPMGFNYPREEMLKEWKKILCNQFHDVIPGSSVRAVYEDTDKMYPEIIAFGENAAGMALAKIVDGINTVGEGDALIVFNTLPWERKDTVTVKLPGEGAYAVLDTGGKEIASQITGGSISFAAIMPSMGYATYRLVKKAPAKVKSELKAGKNGLANKFYKIALDKNGVIKSIVHKATGREVLPKGTSANILRLYEDKPLDWPAWDIDFFYDAKWEDITDLQSIKVTEEGPVSAALEMERKFNGSTIKQKMVIYADNPRIDFETWVDWHENEKVLKVAFPVDVNASKARYEIQFGNVERGTHENTSWDFAKFEVAAHKWADISEEGFGMSLMNDCKYGHHTDGTEMRLTLLRSAKNPDPQADMGEHVFTYSIMPHAGDYIEAGTTKQAYNLNVPMRAIVVKPSKGTMPASKSFFTVDADNVILDTVKKAEKEEATILRFYECHNERADVTVKIDVPFKKIYECNLMERNISEIKSKDGTISFEIKPFEIKTFKLV